MAFSDRDMDNEELFGGRTILHVLNRRKMTSGMLEVNLILNQTTIKSIILPSRPEGKYVFDSVGDSAEDTVVENLYIKGENDQWMAVCTGTAAFLTEEGEKIVSIPLHESSILNLCGTQVSAMLYVDGMDEKSGCYRKYHVRSGKPISIGRVQGNDIEVHNVFVGSRHAILFRDKLNWLIEDRQSKNGLYVNGERVRKKQLSLGDRVYIMGLRIIIGTDFIAVNDLSSRVFVKSASMHPISGPAENEPVPAQTPSGELFNRLPRKIKHIEERTIEIDAPPMMLSGSNMPLVLRMGSQATSGFRSALMGNYLMILTSFMFPLLIQKYTEKERREYETLRVQKYTAYLEQKRREIMDELGREYNSLVTNYPPMSQMLQFPETGRRLWERRTFDEDFLTLRVGSGNLPMMAGLEYPEQRFDLNDDPLERSMYSLVRQQMMMLNAPYMDSLTDVRVTGINGLRETALELAERLIMEIAILHSYDEVKLVLLISENDLNRFSFAGFLPHVWDNQRSIRFIATDAKDAARIGSYIQETVEQDLEKPGPLRQILKKHPYFVVFAFEKTLYESAEILKTIAQADANVGVSVITVYDNVPKECARLFHMGREELHSILYLNEPGKPNGKFRMDDFSREMADRCMKKISNTELRIVTESLSLPKMITFMEMLGMGRIEHLNPLKRWQESNPVKSLAAPVGVSPDGSLFYLDLHEKYQGPHGLVAGSTGSGKSEFIITYILSMALNFHPDEVTFVLIDYKGGGLAGAFEDEERGIHLPHLVGTITNLDGAAIERSLMSIQSELKRRQRIFNKAKSENNEGTMDIYGYQKLYRQGKVSEPVPHLFIISDEFAELKSQQPEFMQKLVSAARIGRSLGVHLILATQKPAGVVDEQIRSNTKFRVCLRVQDKADSMDMLKRPEAAELKDTGRFYLQVGYNEFFALGQSAWCGAPYIPQETVVKEKDDTIVFVDQMGQVITTVKKQVKKEDSGQTQLVAVVQALSALAVREKIVPRKLWTEPLPDRITLEDVGNEYRIEPTDEISVLLGKVDDPENQTQFPLVMDIQNAQNLMIAGQSGSGKTTMLLTMLYSLAGTYSPEEFNFYVVDYSSRMLGLLKNLPHCGAYITDDDESAVIRLIDFVRDIAMERKRLFASVNAANFAAYRAEKNIPLILLVFDNYAGFTATKSGTRIYPDMHVFMKECAGYGIKFVFAVGHVNELSTRSRQEVGTRIALNAKDRFDYSEILNARCNYVPPQKPGRGMALVNERPLEYQTALISGLAEGQSQAREIRGKAAEIGQKWRGIRPAAKLPMLIEDEEYELFASQFSPGRIPLGYRIEDVKPVALPLKQANLLTFYFGNPVGVGPVLRNLLFIAGREQMNVLVMKKKGESLFDSAEAPEGVNSFTILDTTAETCTELYKKIFSEVLSQKVFRDEYCDEKGIPEELRAQSCPEASAYIRKNTRGLMILVESFRDLCRSANADCNTSFTAIFDNIKGYNIYFASCFAPNDVLGMAASPLVGALKAKTVDMLFGGQFDKQGIVSLPIKLREIKDVSKQYNNFILHYRDECYMMQMPCGKLEQTVMDPDDMPII